MKRLYNVKLIITVVVVLLILVISLFVYRNTTFRLVSTNTVNNTLSTSSDKLVLAFSKNIDENLDTSASNIIIEPKTVVDSVTFKDNELYINIYDFYNTKELKVTIIKIDSQDGKSIDNFSKTFKIKYVDFNKLSKEEQARQNAQSNSGEDKYPIINSLPIYTDEYVIDYEFPNQYDDSDKLIIKIDVLGVPSTLAMAEENKEYLDEIRLKAIRSIESLGYSINDFQVEYSEPTIEPGQTPSLPANSD